MKQCGCNTKDIAKLTLYQEHFFAQVIVDEKLSNDVVLVSIFELDMSINNCPIELAQITKANKDEIDTFEQVEKRRIAAANKEKADILVRLKAQDQTIPISFLNHEGE